MKRMYETNSWLVIITILLCFTFWGGIIALPILGLIQIIMSIKIIIHFKQLTKTIKILFITYIVLTISTILFLKSLPIKELAIMFLFMIASLFLASFHLYVTFRINKGNIS